MRSAVLFSKRKFLHLYMDQSSRFCALTNRLRCFLDPYNGLSIQLGRRNKTKRRRKYWTQPFSNFCLVTYRDFCASRDKDGEPVYCPALLSAPLAILSHCIRLHNLIFARMSPEYNQRVLKTQLAAGAFKALYATAACPKSFARIAQASKDVWFLLFFFSVTQKPRWKWTRLPELFCNETFEPSVLKISFIWCAPFFFYKCNLSVAFTSKRLARRFSVAHLPHLVHCSDATWEFKHLRNVLVKKHFCIHRQYKQQNELPFLTP